MARPKKTLEQSAEKIETKKTVITENKKIEPKKVETKAPESIQRTMKVKMLVTYITVGLCLFSGKVYEIDGNLAMKFLKNGECEEC